MRFFAILAAATLATATAAVGGPSARNLEVRAAEGDKPRYSVPDDWTIEQGSAKCGNQAQLSCCNKATYAGDTTTIDDGALAGLLGNIAGTGSGSEGVGLFDQCSKLDLQIPIIGISAQDILNQQCKQNIACCQYSGADASDDLLGVALPCVALGSII
ncbi:hydrophobin family protein [Aspergillus aculeatinus CBS 121060]|uniref:Fungal hydrophobin n=1 Tax=Aspergillus aculeatinus CBS 121060 TaxID=1448322 RepID=A0ACD1GS06_9EURO|nr:fungal hydrophobin [Aspergillus aculeatinus CBS 121060]RAH64130.1 fungal hydrophobin [Aspergillus aculeatinus CBS 121060]